MAHPTSINGETNARDREDLWGSLGELSGNITTLAELQVKLAISESRELVRRAAFPATLVVGGGILILGSLPVALLGVSDLLAEMLHISRSRAMLLTAGTGFAVAAVVLTIALPWLRSSFDSLRNSRDELKRNVAWVRTVLTQSGRGSRRR